MDKESLYKQLENAVIKYEPGADKKMLSRVKKQCVYDEICTSNLNYDLLHDKLLLIGTILEEDENSSTYIAVVKAGVNNSNPCIMAVNLADTKVTVCAFAREGIIKQNTSNKAIEKLKNTLSINKKN